MTPRQMAEAIVDEIMADLEDRSGMGLDGVDAETRAEIRERWVAIVLEGMGV